MIPLILPVITCVALVAALIFAGFTVWWLRAFPVLPLDYRRHEIERKPILPRQTGWDLPHTAVSSLSSCYVLPLTAVDPGSVYAHRP